MAERRMFSKSVVESDAFLMMPLSAQALYFHLNMIADDDGVVNKAKGEMRAIDATQKDLDLLVDMKFLIHFEEKEIYLIKHWKINNYIRNDRYNPSKYRDDLGDIGIAENGAYFIKSDHDETNFTELPEKQPNKPLEGARLKRYLAKKNSDLPNSFEYKMRHAFNGEKCPICGVEMRECDHLTMPSIQHNIPISQGGKHEIGNISVICRSCNCSLNHKATGKLNNDKVVEVWEQIGNVSGMDTENRIDKNRLEENRLDKNSLVEGSGEKEAIERNKSVLAEKRKAAGYDDELF